MKNVSFVVVMLATGVMTASRASFQLEDTGTALRVSENHVPVLVYHYAPVSPPQGVDARYTRGCYIHPLYGLDGDVLSQDFPSDHRHHRGLYWSWPYWKILGRRADTWLATETKQRHEKWLKREVAADHVTLGVQNHWIFQDVPDRPLVREQITFRVTAARPNHRVIDFRLVFTNISGAPITIQPKDYKGYGGFCFRPDATRAPLFFTTALGPLPEDALSCASPWADVSSAIKPGGPVSGMAIFQNPGNPDYPCNGWLLRHYGYLGACWPHTKTVSLAENATLTLRYRVLLHRGSALEADVAGQFRHYARQGKNRP